MPRGIAGQEKAKENKNKNYIGFGLEYLRSD